MNLKKVLFDKAVVFELTPAGRIKIASVKGVRNNVPGRRNRMCEDNEARRRLEHLREQRDPGGSESLEEGGKWVGARSPGS